ncbi:efflux RND transporter periplasmic adaptor subunit [Granulosicoccus antarcticus]|uniref:Efflux pump periplasmic linker BepF n=1 Tax=Granulosicoccus antarcticus IMCC3135 TaxID=1192854 RepID=A0A2Z2P0J8_9GAMM|nr:efflux RND transporter periplasmic adaptor subunit [Granulosicoccus antarcticus]ASJ75638.1 Efflux pump periplasmic linker BepF [Granulosicoccus antarcticus IMCC3135]
MNKSWLAAGAVVIVLSLWMASGLLKPDDSGIAENDKTDPLMTVEVQLVELARMAREISLQGQLEPVQYLQLKAETHGKVENLPISKGVRVNAGDIIVQLDQGNRQNMLTEASARVKSARSEQEAAASLRRQRLQSKVQSEQSEAALESALAQLRSIELDISYTAIKAPFAAVLNALPVDKGALVERGDVVAELVDDSAFDVTARASQNVLAKLTVGQSVSIRLITGEILPGTLTFISSVADAQTRTFLVEARVSNTNGATAAGISASLTIPIEQVEAAFISPSALSLGLDGELGVKAVDEDNRVLFLPIKLVSTDIDGAWVSGIPAGTRIITLGQGFVSVDEQVNPQEVAGASAAASEDARAASSADAPTDEAVDTDKAQPASDGNS